MTLTAKHAAIALGILLALFLAVIGRFAWVEHDAIVKADANAAALNSRIADLQQRIADRDKADAQQQRAAKAEEAKVKTSADAVQVITKYVEVPARAADTPPPAAVVEKKDFTAEEQAKLPESPSYVVQTQESATETAKQLIACKADRQSLDSCRANLFDMNAALKMKTEEAETLQAAANGGTKGQKFGRFLKCSLFSGAGAVAASAAGGTKWVGAGAAAGVAACQLF